MSENGEVLDYSDEEGERPDYSDEPPSDSDIETPEELNAVYTELLIEKSKLIDDFNNGKITDLNEFRYDLADLNRRILASYPDRQVLENDLIEKEIELRRILDLYQQRIYENIDNFPVFEPTQRSRNLFTPEEIKEMKFIQRELEKIYTSHREIEEDLEPLKSNRLLEEWNSLSALEKVKIIKLTGTTPPYREDFTSEPEFKIAEEEYLNDINIFLDNFWVPFEMKEKNE